MANLPQTMFWRGINHPIAKALAACDGSCASMFSDEKYRCNHSNDPHHRRNTLIALAVRRHYGQSAYFVLDKGLLDQGMFGQIGRAAPGQTNCTSFITGRVQISIEE